MQNPHKSTAHRLEWRNDLRDENSTESHNKLFHTLTACSVKNDDLTVLLQCRLKFIRATTRRPTVKSKFDEILQTDFSKSTTLGETYRVEYAMKMLRRSSKTTYARPLRCDPPEFETVAQLTAVTALTCLRLRLRHALIVRDDDLAVSSSHNAHNLSMLLSCTARRVALQPNNTYATSYIGWSKNDLHSTCLYVSDNFFQRSLMLTTFMPTQEIYYT